MYKILIPIQPFLKEQNINYYDNKNNLIGTDTCTLKALPDFCNKLSKENNDLSYIVLKNYQEFSNGIAKKIRSEISDQIRVITE